jgi:hypothetical protein
MKRKRRFFVPIGLPIAGIILLVAGLLLQPVFSGLPEDVLLRNTILNGIPFVMIFVSIILFFITFIWFIASVLNFNIPAGIHRLIERVLIASIVLGILGMFQPWWFSGFRIGFHVLLISTISFILWSHIIPAGIRRQEEAQARPAAGGRAGTEEAKG